MVMCCPTEHRSARLRKCRQRALQLRARILGQPPPSHVDDQALALGEAHQNPVIPKEKQWFAKGAKSGESENCAKVNSKNAFRHPAQTLIFPRKKLV